MLRILVKVMGDFRRRHTLKKYYRHAQYLMATKPEVELFGYVVENQVIIERLTPKTGLRSWFDIDGVAAFIGMTLATIDGPRQEQLYEKFVEFAPRNRAVLAAAARYYATRGEYQRAINLLELALTLEIHDIYVQGLLVEYSLAASGGQNNYGQAPESHWQGRFCHVPFKHFEPTDGGAVFVCCPQNLPYSIGNIYQQSVEEIWNSKVAQELRASILDGSYRYCSKLNCRELLNGLLPKRSAGTEEERTTRVKGYPEIVILNHDRSCNLSCPSCRTEVIMADKKQSEALAAIRPKIMTVARHANLLVVTNGGDPFASKHFRGILRELTPKPKQNLLLYTNAQLFTPSEWEKLQNLRGAVLSVNISVDAIQAGTYEQVRRGGSFEKLTENLEFIAQLRRDGHLSHLIINMTVQSLNFREMPGFVEWGAKLGADKVLFLRLRNWGTFSPEEFPAKDVCASTHPDHAEYQNLLRHPALALPLVDLGTLPRYMGQPVES